MRIRHKSEISYTRGESKCKEKLGTESEEAGKPVKPPDRSNSEEVRWKEGWVLKGLRPWRNSYKHFGKNSGGSASHTSSPWGSLSPRMHHPSILLCLVIGWRSLREMQPHHGLGDRCWSIMLPTMTCFHGSRLCLQFSTEKWSFALAISQLQGQLYIPLRSSFFIIA